MFVDLLILMKILVGDFLKKLLLQIEPKMIGLAILSELKRII